jgi:hypothetical protein
MTVPYAAPPTAVAGQPLAAADWNTKIRDSLESIARPPHCLVYRNTAQLVGNAGLSTVVFLGASAQTDVFWAAPNPSRMTCPAGLAGKYLFQACPNWDISGPGGRYIACLKNGAGVWSVNDGGSAAWYIQQQINCTVDLVAGDYVELGVYQNSGAALNLKGDVYAIYASLTRLGV